MKQGKEAGCSSKEICAAVNKRLIKAGSNLRNYLESQVNILETALIQIVISKKRTLLQYPTKCPTVLN